MEFSEAYWMMDLLIIAIQPSKIPPHVSPPHNNRPVLQMVAIHTLISSHNCIKPKLPQREPYHIISKVFSKVKSKKSEFKGRCVQLDDEMPGVYPPVCRQGKASACVHFSSTDATSAKFFIDKKEMLILSRQEILDCAPCKLKLSPDVPSDEMGCYPLSPLQAFQYLQSFGSFLAKDYKYEGKRGVCRDLPGMKMKIKSFTMVPKNQICRTLDIKQPVVAGIPVFNSIYGVGEGIYMGPTQEEEKKLPDEKKEGKNSWRRGNHCVLLVGHGFDPKTRVPFFLYKNSWGPRFGHRGFGKIAMDLVECGIIPNDPYLVVPEEDTG